MGKDLVYGTLCATTKKTTTSNPYNVLESKQHKVGDSTYYSNMIRLRFIRSYIRLMYTHIVRDVDREKRAQSEHTEQFCTSW